MGAELILTLGVSFILFHGGLQLSLTILSRVAVGLLMSHALGFGPELTKESE